MKPDDVLNQIVIPEIEAQDPTGSSDTLSISPLVAKALCNCDKLDIPIDVLKQDGIEALVEHGLLGYDVVVDQGLRGYAIDVIDRHGG